MHEIDTARKLHVQQVWEGFEIVLGWETRNKYRVLDENQRPVFYAAERKAGLVATLMRQFLGHWRSFTVDVFDEQRQKHLELHFPFRWFFKTLYVKEPNGRHVGKLQQRFAIFHKKFDVLDSSGREVATIKSPLWKIWTFEFKAGNRSIGKVEKKWSGALGEIFTDKDNFLVSYTPGLERDTKILMLATAFMVDIVYFENNQGRKSVTGIFDL